MNAVLEIIKDIYNKNYKQNVTSIIKENQVEDLSSFLISIFEKSNEFKEDELEDYLQKSTILFKTNPLCSEFQLIG